MSRIKFLILFALTPVYEDENFCFVDPDTGENDRKRVNDSDSDSDMSVGRHSLELASSHSSDEDDDYDGPKWEQQLPKNKVLGKLVGAYFDIDVYMGNIIVVSCSTHFCSHQTMMVSI